MSKRSLLSVLALFLAGFPFFLKILAFFATFALNTGAAGAAGAATDDEGKAEGTAAEGVGLVEGAVNPEVSGAGAVEMLFSGAKSLAEKVLVCAAAVGDCFECGCWGATSLPSVFLGPKVRTNFMTSRLDPVVLCP